MAPKRVGVRELKNRATQILRQVRERRVEFTVTLDNVPVARLIPVSADAVQDRRARRLAALVHIDATAERIAAKWPRGVSAVDAIREQRR